MNHRDKHFPRPVDLDGTREYLPHSLQSMGTAGTETRKMQPSATAAPGLPLFPIGSPIPIATGSLSDGQTKARKKGELAPDLELSGEWPRPARHFDEKTGSTRGTDGAALLQMEPDVVENQLRDLEEFPYG